MGCRPQPAFIIGPMKVRRWLLLALVLAILLGLGLLALVRAAPRLVAVSPEPDAQAVPALASLRLTFSRPMDPESVATRLRISPPMPGDFAWEGTTLVFTPVRPWGRGQQVTVTLEAGARARLLGLSLRQAYSWSFTVEQPRLAYLWPSDGAADIYLLDPESGAIQRLTETQSGVLDFNVSLDGSRIYFSAFNATGGTDLFALDRLTQTITPLLACPQDVCRTPRLSPDGAYLAYQRTAIAEFARQGVTEVRLLALEDGEVGEESVVATLPRPSEELSWSTTGWLAYHDAGQQAYVFYAPQSGERTSFPNATGLEGTWSPDGAAFIAPEILAEASGNVNPATQPSHLMRFDPQRGSVTDLTLGMVFEDADPALSPDGTRLAFARKYLDLARWTPGRQLWLMDPDGANARPLTADPLFKHTDFAWGADGRKLAYTRFNQVTLTDPPEIWMVDVSGGDPLRLVIGGYDLQWVP